MRINRQLEAFKSQRNKHALFSMAIAVVMLIAFYQRPQFQDFSFINLSPVYFIFIVCLSFLKKTKNEQPKKNNLLLNILFMTAPFFIINVFALSCLSKFTDYSAVRIAHHIPTPQHIEGQILLNSYTMGSGRNKSHYEDVVSNEPSQQQPLRLVCNFIDRFKSCPLLENFQQQAVSIRYYTDNRQFIYPEVLVLSVTADNTTISSQDFIQIYQQQRNNFLIYLFFMVLIPNLLVINLFWRDHQYQQSQTFRYQPQSI
mgnify:FL=1